MTVHPDDLHSSARRTLALHPGATLADIAAAAGVSRTTVFSRYATRADLLEALAIDAVSQLQEAYTAAGADDPSKPAAEVIPNLVKRLIPLGKDIAFLFRERSLDHNEGVQSRLHTLNASHDGLLQRAQAEGVLRSEVPTAWLSRSLDGLIYAAWEGIDAGAIAELAAPDLVVSLFLAGAGGGHSEEDS